MTLERKKSAAQFTQKQKANTGNKVLQVKGNRTEAAMQKNATVERDARREDQTNQNGSVNIRQVNTEPFERSDWRESLRKMKRKGQRHGSVLQAAMSYSVDDFVFFPL